MIQRLAATISKYGVKKLQLTIHSSLGGLAKNEQVVWSLPPSMFLPLLFHIPTLKIIIRYT